MKSEKILRAIGQMSDDLVEDAEIKNTQVKRPVSCRRMLRMGLAAAVVVCLLTAAVLAAKTWFFDGYQAKLDEPVDVVGATDPNGNSQKGTIYELTFCLPLNETAPELIESYYFPDVSEKYEQSFGYAYAGMERDTLCDITFFWDVPSGEKMGIRFTQESRFGLEQDGYLVGNELRIVAHSIADMEPETQELTLGGVKGLLIIEPEEAIYPRQYFYWSDGDYVFHMWFPLAFTQEEMAQIIGSVKEVDLIQPYLISMTDEELKKTFE